jgi:hypothetical protein
MAVALVDGAFMSSLECCTELRVATTDANDAALECVVKVRSGAQVTIAVRVPRGWTVAGTLCKTGACWVPVDGSGTLGLARSHSRADQLPIFAPRGVYVADTGLAAAFCDDAMGLDAVDHLALIESVLSMGDECSGRPQAVIVKLATVAARGAAGDVTVDGPGDLHAVSGQGSCAWVAFALRVKRENPCAATTGLPSATCAAARTQSAAAPDDSGWWKKVACSLYLSYEWNTWRKCAPAGPPASRGGSDVIFTDGVRPWKPETHYAPPPSWPARSTEGVAYQFVVDFLRQHQTTLWPCSIFDLAHALRVDPAVAYEAALRAALRDGHVNIAGAWIQPVQGTPTPPLPVATLVGTWHEALSASDWAPSRLAAVLKTLPTCINRAAQWLVDHAAHPQSFRQHDTCLAFLAVFAHLKPIVVASFAPCEQPVLQRLRDQSFVQLLALAVSPPRSTNGEEEGAPCGPTAAACRCLFADGTWWDLRAQRAVETLANFFGPCGTMRRSGHRDPLGFGCRSGDWSIGTPCGR